MSAAVFTYRLTRRVAVSAAAAAMLVFAAGCDDTTDPNEEQEPDVQTIRLVIGTQTVDVTPENVTGGPIMLQVGANTITATFLTPGGVPDPVVTPAEFQLNVIVNGGAPITFTRSMTNPFAGTLTATAAVSGATVSVALFHIEEQHNDFGPFPVQVIVN